MGRRGKPVVLAGGRGGCVLVTMLAVGVACSPAAEPTTDAAPTSASPASSGEVGESATASSATSVFEPSIPAEPGRWVEHRTTIEVGDPGAPGGPEVSVSEIVSTSSGYVVAGAVDAAFAVWRSDDLATFERVDLPACCEDAMSGIDVVEYDGSILVGGTGTDDRAILVRSDDDGRSWTSVPAPGDEGFIGSLSQLQATSAGVIVRILDDRSGAPTSRAFRTDDLVTWHPIEFPGARSEAAPWFVSDDDVVFALAVRDAERAEWAVWSSTDGGRSFVAEAGDPKVFVDTWVVVDGRLIGIPSGPLTWFTPYDPPGLAVLRPGVRWERVAPSNGSWGDGPVSMGSIAPSRTGDRHYALTGRMRKANIHYCYDDASTCRQPEAALVATTDGRAWSDVVGVPTLDEAAESWLLADDGGGLTLVGTDWDRAALHVVRWVGDGEPDLRTPNDYAAAEVPTPLIGPDTQWNIGDEVRYPLALGGCESLYVGDERWEPVVPIPDPPPATWPHRIGFVPDLAEGEIYGVARRVAADQVDYLIEGVGVVATFQPAVDQDENC